MKLLFPTILFFLGVITTLSAQAEHVTTGMPAPNFTLNNARAQQINVASFQGKTIVLEWFNPECPFVKKFYSRGDMVTFQRKAREEGAVWLTINSSAPGKQGYISPTEAEKAAHEHALEPEHLLLDPTGAVGMLYGAKTTPHIFVIDPKGIVAYAGAIDSVPSTKQSDIANATNYALGAIQAIAKGSTPTPASTQAYGCSVKYRG